VNKAVDRIQERITGYVCDLKYEGLPPEVVHATKVRIIDTLGALIAGFFNEPSRIARNLAAQMPDAGGATVLGTRMKTALDMAAFVNATTARDPELTDTYHHAGSYHSHPSDVITPAISAAEHVQAGGRELITSIVAGYEVFLRFADVFPNRDFDHTMFSCLGSAVVTGKLLGLSPAQFSHCISMAVVPNVILRQVRTGHSSHFKAAASGNAARGGVFAALMADAGMEGPHLPFEGKAGWCDHVARTRFSLGEMGGNGTPFRLPITMIKPRACCGTAISSAVAAEKIGTVRNAKDVKKITVEVYAWAKESVGTGEHRWNPESRETADHSIPYVVAATLVDGTLTPRSFNDAHLWNPELRALMQKVEVVENPEFTRAYSRNPQEHRTRITVVSNSGEQRVGETGGAGNDIAEPWSDARIAEKFRGLTEDYLGAKRVNALLDQLWHLEDMTNVSGLPADFNLD